MCTWIYHDKRYHLSMICVCIIIYPEWLFFNGIRTGVSQLCLGDIPRRENPTDFFSIPKISNYRRYHPQMVALRQWLSHMIHPLGHPWAIPNGPSPNRGAEGRPWNTDGAILLAFPRAKSGEPRDSHHVLIMFPSWPWLQVWGPTWNPFLQLKRGYSLEVSK